MAYVGIGNRQDYVADFQSQNFSGDGSTTAFTLNYEAVTGSIRVAVDNVLQPADGSSYTCNGFTLNFSAAPASGTDNITVLFLGTVRNIASVSDGAIVASKLASNAVETAKILDGAVTSAKMFSGFANGITEADQWRLTANITTNVDPISANLERVDNTGAGYLGTGMSVASGIWTFPSTGLWRVEANAITLLNVSDNQCNLNINQYISGVATNVVSIAMGGAGTTDSASGNFLYNVTDTATHQITFSTLSVVGSTMTGNTDINNTYFTFTRLGDSV